MREVVVFKTEDGAPHALLLGVAYFQKQQFERALPSLLTAVQERPMSLLAHTILAACYGHMGRFAEARQMMAREADLRPTATTAAESLYGPQLQKLISAGLQLVKSETT